MCLLGQLQYKSQNLELCFISRAIFPLIKKRMLLYLRIFKYKIQIQIFAKTPVLDTLSRSIAADDNGDFLKPLLLFWSMDLDVVCEEAASLALFSSLLLFQHRNYATLFQESQIGEITWSSYLVRQSKTASNLTKYFCKSLTCHYMVISFDPYLSELDRSQ